MEQYYYNHMDKQKQAAYHAMLQGIRNLTDEFQIPALDADSLYNVFFQLRLDHPEIFWATGYKYRYYKDSSEGNDCTDRQACTGSYKVVRMGKGKICA